jgi:serine beta-lactamase-like protein LACTB
MVRIGEEEPWDCTDQMRERGSAHSEETPFSPESRLRASRFIRRTDQGSAATTKVYRARGRSSQKVYLMKQRTLLSIAIAFMILASPPLATPNAATLSATKMETIEAALAAERSRWHAPGLSAAIVADHHLVWSRGLGLADLEQRVPATPATVYRIASISKTITAVAVMQLAEQAKLDLDAPIQRYCPGFPEKPWPITARQLLAHLGGIRGYLSTEELYNTRHYTNLVEPLALFKDDPLQFEPGAQFSYTTYGYTVLGCAIEGASGMTYVDYVREHILQAVGMSHTRPDDVYAIIANRAQSYRKAPNGAIQNAPPADPSYKIPGGGWCSTVDDLAKFAVAVQTDGLVAKDTLEQMFTRQKTRDGHDLPFGLGWAIGERNGHQEVWHTGGLQGVSTILYMRPEQGFAAVLLLNVNGLASPPATAPVLGLARQLAEIVLLSPQLPPMARGNQGTKPF